jgi:dienelactone hydrolase
MAAHPVDSSRVYLTGVSAGGAMAVLAAIAYPEIYAALAVHSGIGYKAAETLASALAAIKGEGPPARELARRAHAAMGPRARALPLMAGPDASAAILRFLLQHRLLGSSR